MKILYAYLYRTNLLSKDGVVKFEKPLSCVEVGCKRFIEQGREYIAVGSAEVDSVG